MKFPTAKRSLSDIATWSNFFEFTTQLLVFSILGVSIGYIVNVFFN